MEQSQKKWYQRIPERLGRVTSNGRFIGEIDGLRFLAIFPVVIQHLSERMTRNLPENLAEQANSWGAEVTQNGGVGVYVFFVISGFILSLPFAKMHLYGGRKVSLTKYFKRRLTRLEPPYIIWMTVFFFVLLLKGTYAFSEVFPHFLASLTYLHNAIFLKYSWINPVTWSLEIEVQFYILAPLISRAFFMQKDARKRLISQLVLFSLIVSAQFIFGWTTYPYKLFLIGHIQYFLLGFILADLFLTHKEWFTAKSNIWDLIGSVGIVMLIFTHSEEWSNLLFILANFLAFMAAFKGKVLNRFFTNPWITAIGGMCYTIYLIHLPFLEVQIIFTKNFIVYNSFWFNIIIQSLIALPLIFLISSAGFLLIEKPCMDSSWPKKLANKIRRIASGNWKADVDPKTS
jgi:peptidoglycan/LPS O-acetylase OafA/YrhL